MAHVLNVPPRSFPRLITCNLTKPESTLDQIRKSFPKLKPTDAALIAIGLVLSGRYAVANHEGEQLAWPDDLEKMTASIAQEIQVIQSSVEATKKAAKAAAEEEAVEIKVDVAPNLSAGEQVLGDREDLKTMLSDIMQKGVEFVYAPTDIGWQWGLDRANWQTLAGVEINRKVKLKVAFTGESVGVEMGATTTKKRASKAKAVVAEPEETAELETEVATEEIAVE